MYTYEEYETYLKVKRELLFEDAKNYSKDYIENAIEDFTEEQFNKIDFDFLVEQFEERVDYFDPTAEAWENIVANYFENYYFDEEA